MLSLDLVELADLTRPTEIVAEIIRQTPQDTISPTPIRGIAWAAGIKEIQEKKLENLEGALVANPTKSEGIIVINQDARHHRKRFTLGHELGHFLIPRHGHKMECSMADMMAQSNKDCPPKRRIEVEANTFSAELLMPSSRFCSIPSFNQEPTVSSISELAQIFDVSFQASANRFMSLHEYPIAIVFSRNGRILYGYKGSNIPFWLNVNKNELVPAKCHTKTVNVNAENQISNDEVVSSIWFNKVKGYMLPDTLIEETLVQDDGYAATLLWFEDEIEEVE